MIEILLILLVAAFGGVLGGLGSFFGELVGQFGDFFDQIFGS